MLLPVRSMEEIFIVGVVALLGALLCTIQTCLFAIESWNFVSIDSGFSVDFVFEVEIALVLVASVASIAITSVSSAVASVWFGRFWSLRRSIVGLRDVFNDLAGELGSNHWLFLCDGSENDLDKLVMDATSYVKVG